MNVRKGVLFIYIKLRKDDNYVTKSREVFDAILEAKIPYGRTRTVLKLVSQALQNVTPGEVETKREKTDYPICSD